MAIFPRTISEYVCTNKVVLPSTQIVAEMSQRKKAQPSASVPLVSHRATLHAYKTFSAKLNFPGTEACPPPPNQPLQCSDQAARPRERIEANKVYFECFPNILVGNTNNGNTNGIVRFDLDMGQVCYPLSAERAPKVIVSFLADPAERTTFHSRDIRLR